MRYKTKDRREIIMIEVGDRFDFRGTVYEAASLYHDGGIDVIPVEGSSGPSVSRIACRSTETVIILN